MVRVDPMMPYFLKFGVFFLLWFGGAALPLPPKINGVFLIKARI